MTTTTTTKTCFCATALSPATTTTTTTTKLNFPYKVFSSIIRKRELGLLCRYSNAAVSTKNHGAFDPELRIVLELATDSELYELEKILFGPSYFSPLLKSLIGCEAADMDYAMIADDLEERDEFIAALESRFLFLAADARSTLRGLRPMYRDVLLSVRKKLKIPCSRKLPTEDLEVEIFLHLVQNYSSEQSGIFPGLWESSSNVEGSLELGLDQYKVPALAASKVGAAELKSLFLKGGSMLTLAKIYQLLARTLSGKMVVEAANYEIHKGILKKGGEIAATNLESIIALLAAKQGFAGAASRLVGLRSMVTFLGPMMWGTFLADIIIQMLGTDYARILRAIYAFAQIDVSAGTGRYELVDSTVFDCLFLFFLTESV
ncbi:hypothetical protein ACFE04_008943 [Oxalis oulophora]